MKKLGTKLTKKRMREQMRETRGELNHTLHLLQETNQHMDSGRGLCSDQSDCSLPRGQELTHDFTG